jgi:hypothetical protein
MMDIISCAISIVGTATAIMIVVESEKFHFFLEGNIRFVMSETSND